MPIDARMRAQINLILDSFPDAAAHPEISLWDNVDVDDVEYLYRKQTILARDQDAVRVADAIAAFFEREGYREPAESDQPSERTRRSAAIRTGTRQSDQAGCHLHAAGYRDTGTNHSRHTRPGTRAGSGHAGPHTLRVSGELPRDRADRGPARRRGSRPATRLERAGLPSAPWRVPARVRR